MTPQNRYFVETYVCNYPTDTIHKQINTGINPKALIYVNIAANPKLNKLPKDTDQDNDGKYIGSGIHLHISQYRYSHSSNRKTPYQMHENIGMWVVIIKTRNFGKGIKGNKQNQGGQAYEK